VGIRDDLLHHVGSIKVPTIAKLAQHLTRKTCTHTLGTLENSTDIITVRLLTLGGVTQDNRLHKGVTGIAAQD
jgi:hypothetical protein